MSSVFGRTGSAVRRAVLVAAGLAALAAPAAAQNAALPPPGMTPPAAQAPGPQADPERLALAREYVRESRLDSAMRGMFANIARSMPQLPADEAGQARAEQFMDSFAVGMDATLPMLLESVAQTTARTFTVQELRDLVAFYGSPSGQSMVAKMPALLREMGPLAFQILPKVYPVAEEDFCRHVTCTEADHLRFRRLESSLAAGVRPPPPSNSPPGSR
jgi:hypothetical protein